jgi:hypothetical protein
VLSKELAKLSGMRSEPGARLQHVRLRQILETGVIDIYVLQDNVQTLRELQTEENKIRARLYITITMTY